MILYLRKLHCYFQIMVVRVHLFTLKPLIFQIVQYNLVVFDLLIILKIYNLYFRGFRGNSNHEFKNPTSTYIVFLFVCLLFCFVFYQ